MEVEINGAEATAGSMPTCLKNRGTRVPMAAAVVIFPRGQAYNQA